jgi:hypothetical protein
MSDKPKPNPALQRSVPVRTRPPLSRGARETLLCLGAIGAALAVGLGVELAVPGDRVAVLVVAGGFALATILVSWNRRLRDALSGFRFAGILLAILGVLVMVGTFVPQGKTEEIYRQSYGGAAGVLIATGVTRLFHGAWFAALLGLLAGALFTSTLQRLKQIKRNAGFAITHLGLILILGGAGASSVLAVRGRIDLRVGEDPATRVAVTKGGARTGEHVLLPFGVRLDGFKVDRYQSEHRMALYQLTGADGNAKQLATWDPEIGVTQRLPDGARYRIDQLLDDVHAGESTGHGISEDGGPARPIAVGGELTLSDGAILRALAYFPDFYFDLKTHTAATKSEVPNNPALEVTITAPGGSPQRQFLLAASPGVAHGTGRGGLAFVPAGGDSGGHAEPGVVLELTDDQGVRTARLVAAHRDAIFFGKKKALTFERRGEEAKAYVSRVTIVGGGREEAKVVSVNAPITVSGWTFYQSNYDPRDPTYSGLEAVRDPGIPWVFAGFLLVCVGVPYMVNLAPWLRRREQNAGKEARS